MIWKRLVDPECPDIPRPGFNSSDPETTDLDITHTQRCLRCANFITMMDDEEEDDVS
jgi:hypothetical protein